MKKKFSSIWRVMIALVLVASLGLVFAVPAGAINGLLVTITDPTGTPDVFVGELFAVTATVDNTGSDTAQNVTMTITWEGDAELVPVDASPTINVGDIPTYWDRVETVNWTLKCTGPKDLDIKVTANADNRSPAEDKEYVNQLYQEELTVTITPSGYDEICACENFWVYANVENTGDFAITGIDVELVITSGVVNILDTNPVSISDLAKGANTDVSWEVHCLGAPLPCEVHNWVDLKVTATGTGSNSGDPVNAEATVDEFVDQKWLIVTITYPTDCTDRCTEEPLNEFIVTADIENCYDVAVTGVATVSWNPPSGAKLDFTPPELSQVITIPANSTASVLPWHLECELSGDLVITVNFHGEANGRTLCDYDEVEIHQRDPAVLGVTLSGETCVGYCTAFLVTATITNTGDATATSVQADISWTGDVTKTSGDDPQSVSDIAGGATEYATWMFHCDDYQDATFDVNVTGLDIVCATVLDVDSNTLNVTQIDLDISIATNPTPPYRPSQEFDVTATLTNNDDVPITVGNVVIDTGTHASLNKADTASKDVGEIPVGESQEISWTLHCDTEGSSIITVTANVTEPCGVTIEKDITVDQEYPPTIIEVEILSPDTGSKYATSEEFAVTAVITNTGDQPAVNVGAGIIWHNATTVEGTPEEKVFLDDLEPGESHVVTWTLHCDESGMTFIMVHAWATNKDEMQETCDLFDSVIVWQYPASHLVVDIMQVEPESPFVTSTEFYVTAKITNTGEADATEVYATLSVNPDGSVRVSADDPEGTYTKYLGTIPGHGSEDNYKLVTWLLHCKVPSESELTVTATGNDEYGWHIKQQSQTTGNFIIEYGALVSEELESPFWDPVLWGATGTPMPTTRGWSYGLFVGDINGLAPGPFIVDTDLSMAQLGGGPDYLGHIVGMGFVIPHMEETGFFEYLIESACLLPRNPDGLDLEGKDFMFWVVHIEMDSPFDMIGPWSEWCVGPGLIEVINGTIAGTYTKWNPGFGTWQDSLLGGTFHSNMAAEAGRAIPDRFIEPDGVTVKQLPLSVDLKVTKEVVGDDTVTVGEAVTFTITLENLGPSDATNVWVYDLLPAGLNFSSWSADQGYYYVGSGQWSVGDLASGVSATLTIVATVNTVGEIYNGAGVGYADQHDPVTGNNADVVMVEGLEPPDIDYVELDTGWNLVSMPLYIPEANRAPTTLLATIISDGTILDTVHAYDACEPDPLLRWTSFSTTGPPGDLTEIRDGPGYWFEMTSGATLDVDGTMLPEPPETPPTYQVCEGWNLIGFKSTMPRTPADYLAGIAGNYVMIYGFADDSYFIAGSPGHEFLQPGLGYWIAVTEPGPIYP